MKLNMECYIWGTPLFNIHLNNLLGVIRDINLGQALEGRRQDGGGVGRGKHFLPHKFIKRAFKRRVNATKQLLNAGRGHQAPRKATQLLERR